MSCKFTRVLNCKKAALISLHCVYRQKNNCIQTTLWRSLQQVCWVRSECHPHSRPYLGTVIGSQEYVEEYVSSKVWEWLSSRNILSDIAKSQPHAAFSALTHDLLSKWTYLSQFVPDISHLVYSHFVNSHFVNSHFVNIDQMGIDKVGSWPNGNWRSGNWQSGNWRSGKMPATYWFDPLDDVLRTNLIPAITEQSPLNNLERDFFALPAQHGGLGIRIPSKMLI